MSASVQNYAVESQSEIQRNEDGNCEKVTAVEASMWQMVVSNHVSRSVSEEIMFEPEMDADLGERLLQSESLRHYPSEVTPPLNRS